MVYIPMNRDQAEISKETAAVGNCTQVSAYMFLDSREGELNGVSMV